ncbi:MAG: hypothetical protein M9894_14830 [Planctomycetes bacterium]|nr:hypothetical protein [Planctomycetota bacterium]
MTEAERRNHATRELLRLAIEESLRHAATLGIALEALEASDDSRLISHRIHDLCDALGVQVLPPYAPAPPPSGPNAAPASPTSPASPSDLSTRSTSNPERN